MYSDFNFTKVYLMLGQACDFNCRHCLQHPAHNHLTKHPSEKLIRYLQHLADIRPHGLRRISPTINLTFFGGEPLLYMNSVKEVMEKVNRKNVRYTLISNGNTLNRDHVDFFNSEGVHFAVSNDGPKTDRIRDRNVLEDDEFLRLFNRIDSRSICTTLHAFNQDLYALWDYLKEKCGDIPLSYEFLVLNWQMPEDIYSYDFAAWERTCERVKQRLFEAYSGSTENISHLREAQLFLPYINNRFRFLENKAEFPLCGSYRQHINLDLDGNHYLCHNGFGKFSSCENEGTKVANMAQVRFLKLRQEHGKPCGQCDALPFCHEGCPFSAWSSMQEKQCRFMKIFSSKIREFMDLVDRHNTTEIDL